MCQKTLGAKRNCRRVSVASCSTELSRKRQRCTKTDLGRRRNHKVIITRLRENSWTTYLSQSQIHHFGLGCHPFLVKNLLIISLNSDGDFFCGDQSLTNPTAHPPQKKSTQGTFVHPRRFPRQFCNPRKLLNTPVGLESCDKLRLTWVPRVGSYAH